MPAGSGPAAPGGALDHASPRQLQDQVCSTVREVVQGELSRLRHDLGAILREELLNGCLAADAAPSASKSTAHAALSRLRRSASGAKSKLLAVPGACAPAVVPSLPNAVPVNDVPVTSRHQSKTAFPEPMEHEKPREHLLMPAPGRKSIFTGADSVTPFEGEVDGYYMSSASTTGRLSKQVLQDARELREEWERKRQSEKQQALARESLRSRARRLVVDNPQFDTFFGLVVIANAGILGIQVDWMARNEAPVAPPIFRWFEKLFCVAFTVEWILRLAAYGRQFFSRDLWHWHAFDSLLVGTQLFEEIALLSVSGFSSLISSETANTNSQNGNFSWLRVLRFLRLVRVMRTVRILRLVGELRTLVLSILGSLRALVWAVLLLLLLMYVIGIFITQLVLDYRLELVDGQQAMTSDTQRLLLFFYGSLGDTIYSVYQGVTGGVDWGNLVDPLRLHISVYMVPFFMLYVAFATLCMLNVITGVFVESALACTKNDTQNYLLNRLKALFTDSDLDGDGKISSMEFFMAADSPEVKAVFEQLNLQVKDAELVFGALDSAGNGALSVEEFVKGCQDLASPAKTLELVCMRHEQQLAIEARDHRDQRVEALLQIVGEQLAGLQMQKREEEGSPAGLPWPSLDLPPGMVLEENHEAEV